MSQSRTCEYDEGEVKTWRELTLTCLNALGCAQGREESAGWRVDARYGMQLEVQKAKELEETKSLVEMGAETEDRG